MLIRLLKTIGAALFCCFGAWVAGFDFSQRGVEAFIVLCIGTSVSIFVFIVSGD